MASKQRDTQGLSKQSDRKQKPEVVVEFVVEPRDEAGQADQAEIADAAFSQTGLSVTNDSYGGTSGGSVDEIVDAVGTLIRTALASGMASVRIHVGRADADLAVAPLHDALELMIRSAEREIGSPPSEWTRQQCKAVLRQLDQQGAFLLRGAVDDLARILGVSRITVYNYLNDNDQP